MFDEFHSSDSQGQRESVPQNGIALTSDPIAAGHGYGDTLSGHAGGDPIDQESQGPRDTLVAGALLVDPTRLAEIAEVCAELRQHYRRAVFMEKQRKSMNNRTLAFVRVQYLGWNLSLPEPQRARITRESVKLVAAARRGEGDPDLVAMIKAADAAAEVCEAYEEGALKRIEKLAKGLPGIGFVTQTPGLGLRSFARIVGEAGPLHLYDNPSKLWKRMGLAVIEGERQQKKTGGLAQLHGYNPSRRAVSWNMFEAIMKRQLRKGENGETIAVGEYCQLYLDAKAGYLQREWTRIHAHNAAKRYAEKRVLRDLWRSWRADLRQGLAN